MTSIGFIGLGSQGGPMARRIAAAGLPLVLWARRAEALEQFADLGARAAASVSELGACCGHVGVCVVDDAGTRQICEQLITSMRAGSRIAIHSTVHPDTVVSLARAAQARGIVVLDAPVSGGGPAAAAGKLTVMLGGPASECESARPVLETFGGLIVRLGDVGAGQKAKLVNNALMAAHLAVAHQGSLVSDALGIERKALQSLVSASSGRSFGFEVYARMPSPTSFQHGAKLLAKDLRLLEEVLGQAPLLAPLTALSRDFLTLAQQD